MHEVTALRGDDSDTRREVAEAIPELADIFTHDLTPATSALLVHQGRISIIAGFAEELSKNTADVTSICVPVAVDTADVHPVRGRWVSA